MGKAKGGANSYPKSYRAAALGMLRRGDPPKLVAYVLGVHIDTVRKWAKLLKDERQDEELEEWIIALTAQKE